MKKIIFCFSFIFCFGISAFCQMSDDQVISYVTAEHAKGSSENSIVMSLVKRGVTQAQMERIKKQQEKKQNVGSLTSANTIDKIERTNPEGIMPDDYFSSDFADIESRGESQIFGKSIFQTKNLSFTPALNIPTPANYKLGPGDQVVIDVWGASQTSIIKTISPEGSITVDRLGPIYLNGMTIKDANTHIQRKFSGIYSGLDGGASQVKLTLGQIRTIQIQVMGEVVLPGTFSLSSLSSVFHALYSAGGVNEIGSLREIKLYRAGKLLQTLDIYEYILQGKLSNDVRMMDGDVIIVPTYSSLVAISGGVKRPMIYEALPKETVSNLISYSGGFKGDAYTKTINVFRKTNNENKIFSLDGEEYKTFVLEDSDSIYINTGYNLYENRVEIKGAVFREGYYEIGKGISTVKQLILAADGIKGDAFLNRAVLTREKSDFTTEILSIDVYNILNKDELDIPLRKNDILYIPSISDLIELGDINIEGYVSRPGDYKFSDNITLEDLIVQAGGLLESASTAKVDIARRIMDPKAQSENRILSQEFTFALKDGFVIEGDKNFTLRPYDRVYIRKSPGYHEQRNVYLEGEVLFEGPYALNKKAERLSDVIKRAGSLTKDAYPKGARLIRAKTQQDKLMDQAKIDMAKQKGGDSISLETLELGNTFSVGIELDMAIANPGSDYDMVLQANDRIIIPEYNSTVKIEGAVMYPNTVLYKKGKGLSYYVNQAGGYANRAKKSKSYVVYMNGTVSRVRSNSIQPGAEIIVPLKGERRKVSVGEMVGIGTSVTSMASVVALLINSLSNNNK